MKIRLSKPLDDEHSAKPAGAEYWHIWTVRIPRRSIAGRGLCGVAFGDAMMDTVGSMRIWRHPNQTSPGKARTHAVLAAAPGKSPIDFRDKKLRLEAAL
jgi:hypothetical protein